jgi:hypothetical protein
VVRAPFGVDAPGAARLVVVCYLFFLVRFFLCGTGTPAGAFWFYLNF